jgi:transcriptional regulator with XRE-family HTH domain
MPLRKAYAEALQFVRARLELSQLDIASSRAASYISRLEAAQSSVTVQVSGELAEAMNLHPLSLLALVYAAKEHASPGDILRHISDELAALELLDAQVISDPERINHPLVAKGVETTRAIHALKHAGHSQAEVARLLNISTSTVGRHWQRVEK